MLVISRKAGESVMIGDDVEVRITQVGRDGQVRLSIHAPQSVAVWRRELFDAMKADGQTPPTPDQRAGRESR